MFPTRHRLLYFFSNRYIIHTAFALVIAFTIWTNWNGREVRAESFGKESLLYSLIAQADTSVVEVVTAGKATQPIRPVTYANDASVSSLRHSAGVVEDATSLVTIVGGSAVSTPPIRKNAASVKARSAVETYGIEPGDTLSSIGESFGLKVSTLLWANKLTFRSVIRPGQRIVIPPVDGVIYQIKKGDTVSGIAKTYGADAQKIAAYNQLGEKDMLAVGAQIIIPDGEPPAPPPTRTPAPVSQVFAKATPKGISTGTGTWKWPTDWRVITQYFKGWRHTGIDIDGDYSTQSYAAADGEVKFAGWKGGYGLCIEIDHGNGIVTRYGHHSKNFVAKGDLVTVGQAIAQTGTTGRSTGTHLHFEVIKNGAYLNPLDYVR
ncbi:MAG: Peptidase M23 [Candidatus Uhrbacteria bacterium GW2011_GWA2_53_10]|uniref:Peptidase M23 n=1 Tax=Candidatus Uhrbacteria bacterium GW2011_GWA2_53_10 TaxID=1618980 RepID=A0A0G1ZWY5_9BACT|nr:MAG: Peptidase M23 [Candidatus Uhrbacteria bacterium GW2011_GWA2_53_10]